MDECKHRDIKDTGYCFHCGEKVREAKIIVIKVCCPRCEGEMKYKGKFTSKQTPGNFSREYHCDRCNLSVPTLDPDTSPFKKRKEQKWIRNNPVLP